MIKQFRVLAISKETKSYESEMIRNVFGCNNPALDVVDTIPPTTALNIITNAGWQVVSEVTDSQDFMFIAFDKLSY